MSSTPRPALHEEDFLTTRQAASLLGVALRTVQLWVEAGKLSAWKTRGGHRRIFATLKELIMQRMSARLSTRRRGEPVPGQASRSAPGRRTGAAG